MIKHIVFWTVKHRENEQTRAETSRAIKREIDGMRGKIPGLIRIEGGIDFSGTADSCDVVLYAELESREALAGYQVHAAHEAFKAFIGDRRVARYLVDYDTERD